MLIATSRGGGFADGTSAVGGTRTGGVRIPPVSVMPPNTIPIVSPIVNPIVNPVNPIVTPVTPVRPVTPVPTYPTTPIQTYPVNPLNPTQPPKYNVNPIGGNPNPALGNWLGNIVGGGSTPIGGGSLGTGVGSVIGNFLSGGSTAGGSLANLAGIGVSALVGGPIGLALGSLLPMTNIGDQLDRFIKSGFNFTCLGAQAFKESDVKRLQGVLKGVAEPIFASGNAKQIENLLNDLQVASIHFVEFSGRLRSKCSKGLAQEYSKFLTEFVEGVLAQYPSGSYTRNNESHTQVIYREGDNLGPILTRTINKIHLYSSQSSANVPEWFATQYAREAEMVAQQTGVSVANVLPLLYQEYLKNGGSATGTTSLDNSYIADTRLVDGGTGNVGVRYDSNGRLIYDVNLTNKPQNNNLLLLLGVGVLLLMFNKK